MSDVNTRCTCCGLLVTDDWLFECSDFDEDSIHNPTWVCGTCVGMTEEDYFEGIQD